MRHALSLLVCIVSTALLHAADDDVKWELVDERAFSGQKRIKDYHPYYVIQADEIGIDGKSIEWQHYPDEPVIEYNPEQEYLLNSSRVFDRWIRVAKQTPHTVKWELEFFGGDAALLFDEDGITIGRDPDHEGIPLAAQKPHTVSIERFGKRLRVSVDKDEPRSIEVKEDSRTPLRFTAQVKPVLLRKTRLWFGNGEKLAPPPEKAAQAAPKWEKVFSEDFTKAESANLFKVSHDANVFGWNKDAAALEMGPDAAGQRDETFVMLRRSLPGDLRMSFRARSTMQGQPAFFGVFAGLKGKLAKCDGYFIEWNYWQVQIKKRGKRVAGEKVSYQNEDANQWMKFCFEKVGSTITMYTEGKKMLSFDDENMERDSSHDLLSFYSWRVPMQFDDLVIERNANDTVAPRADDPAVPENYELGERDGKKQTLASTRRGFLKAAFLNPDNLDCGSIQRAFTSNLVEPLFVKCRWEPSHHALKLDRIDPGLLHQQQHHPREQKVV